MHNWQELIANRLHQVIFMRKPQAKTAGNNRLLQIEENCYLNFISNDYLGLSLHPKLRQYAIAASHTFGIGSTGAPTLSGYSQEHQLFSSKLASWLGFAKALLFSSGYHLNSSIYKQLCDFECQIWLDKNCHASHIDGLLLAKAKFTTFKATQFAEISAIINARKDIRHILLSEGSFSMDGTCQYLPEMIKLKQQNPNNLLLIIDDAHGIGALGAQGFGTIEQLGLEHQHIDLYIGTLGKAFGCHGGFVCGDSQLIDYLQQTTRSQLFSTALPPLIVAAAKAALEIISDSLGATLRTKLQQNINYFQETAKIHQLPLYNPEINISPIQLLLFEDMITVEYLYDKLMEQGFRIGKIFYPTVPKDKPRLRISITAHHHFTDLAKLVESLAKLIKQKNISLNPTRLGVLA